MDQKALWDANKGRAMAEVYWSNPAPVILPKDHVGLYTYIADQIGRDRVVDYLEFGVAHGRSIRIISELFTNPYSRFFGFDSFVGLPEKWLMHDVGAFSNQGKAPALNDARVQFVKGWFQNTVPEFLQTFRKNRDRTVLVHYDADLYSSTLFLMANLWWPVDEYYFIFDDFIFDECIAIRDFLSAYPAKITFMAQTRGGGDRPNPDQVFGHIKRVPFELPAPG